MNLKVKNSCEKKDINKGIRGITLIALVVTIVVLLILAGISISMLTGQNGIIKRASEAKDLTDTSQDLEYLKLKATESLTDYYQGNDTTSEDDYILSKWDADQNNKITVNKTDKTFIYNGKTYSISDIIGNQSEKSKIENENMTQITISNATDNDKTLLSNGKIRLIIEENDSSMRAAVPNGFYYVTGTPSTGLVISDRYGDDDENTKGGNQLVWVPCSGDKGVTYEKEKGLAKTWKSKYSDKSYYYNSYKSEDTDITIPDGTWTDNGGNLDSVKTYGGFYIARYEAGVPSTADFYANKDGAIYESESKKNVGTGSPVSKKNNQSWNFISQENAVKVSSNMYSGSQVVTSSLVDSYAWDTIVEWMTKDGAYKNLGNDSSNKGNYYNNDKISLSNVLYALHRYGTRKNTTVRNIYWSYATKYSKGAITSGGMSIDAISGAKYNFTNNDYDTTNYNYTIRKELATGSSEETKVNNIYDMAGNMWEWTTETGRTDEDHTVHAVRRGGGFDVNGSTTPVSYRHGDYIISDCHVAFGFRVVLYIQ